MIKRKKSNENYDVGGSYTGKYLNENYLDEVVLTEPEQDADDL